MNDLDEVALNVLLAEGVDPATALAGSMREDPQPVESFRYDPWQIGLILGVVVGIVWLMK